MRRLKLTLHGIFLIPLLFLTYVPLLSAEPQNGAQQIPSEVESQAQNIENKFSSVLAQECDPKLCSPVGCEVTGFRTLDEKQTASLPGLDNGDEVAGSLQYKLSAVRCEFAYEPQLADEAVASLRRRLAEKVRLPRVTVNVISHRLSAANPGLKAVQDPLNLSSGNSLQTEIQSGLLQASAKAVPGILLTIILTVSALVLIWAYRRLGRDTNKKPSGAQQGTGFATGLNGVEPTPQTEVSVAEIEEKKQKLKETFAANPKLAEAAFATIVNSADVNEICRILKHFGPEPLTVYSNEASLRDLFITVHQRYGEMPFDEDNSTQMAFFNKVERLTDLARLGRPTGQVNDDLNFLRDLAPDEFSQLVVGLDHEELMAILSFVPPRLRTQFLQSRDSDFIEAYTQHLLKYPRLPEKLLRSLAHRLHDQYSQRHADIRRVGRDQLRQIEQLLNTLAPEQRRQMYANLRTGNPALFQRLSSEILLDSALVLAPEAVLNNVFLTLLPEEAASYLAGNADAQSILAKLKPTLAQSIRNRLGGALSGHDFLEVNPSTAAAARLKVNEIVKAMAERGDVDLRKMNESAMDTQ